MSRSIIVSNESTVVSDADAAVAVQAIQTQIDRDFAPAYGGLRADLVFWPKSKGVPPTGQEIVHILDNADVADALGYHELNPKGYPEGFCFAKTTMQAGDAWQTTLSHEVLEQILDPLACWTSQAAMGGKTVWVALEACDPVEGDSYSINGVPLSNFVLPYWWTGGKGKVDFLGKLTQGLTLDAGGYIAYADSTGNWQQILGREADPKGAPRYSRNGRYALQHHQAMRGFSRLYAYSVVQWWAILQSILKAAPGAIASIQQVVNQIGAMIPGAAPAGELTGPVA